MKKEEFRKILTKAIGEEVEAYAFYQGVNQKVSDADMKAVFADLAAQERQHRELLEDFLTRPASSFHFDESKDYKLSTEMEMPAVSVDMKPVDGIKLAIKKEEEAMKMYEQLASVNTDTAQKKIFNDLSAMERGHKARLEDIYTNMAFPEVW